MKTLNKEPQHITPEAIRTLIHLSKMKRLIIVITLIGFGIRVNGQTFHDDVQSVFNFIPHKLTTEEQKKLFPKLDEFFSKVINDKKQYLPLLRDELKRKDNNPYFYYDGGILLFEVSTEPSDLQLIADALVKCDLQDIPPRLYLQHILRLSVMGANVIDAAMHVFDDPKFQVFIEQHALLLNGGECLKFILPRYSSELYVPELIARYPKSSSDTSKYQILELLYYSRSCSADKFLADKLNDPEESTVIKNVIQEIMNSNASNSKEEPKKYNKIRDQIRSKLTRVSDEALEELSESTKALSLLYQCAGGK
jgi:hypothetical protein